MVDREKSLLESLITQDVKRSKIGRVRELFEEIEEAQSKGVRNADLVVALNEKGLELNLKTFENMLHRIRKERLDSGVNKTSKAVIGVQDRKSSTPQSNLGSGKTSYSVSDWAECMISSQRLIDDLNDEGLSPSEVKSWDCPTERAIRNKLTEFTNKKSRKKGI